MKIGDIRTHRNFKFTGCHKTDVLALFDKYEDEDKERKLLDLMQKKREVNEAAKKLL